MVEWNLFPYHYPYGTHPPAHPAILVVQNTDQWKPAHGGHRRAVVCEKEISKFDYHLLYFYLKAEEYLDK